MDSAHHDKKTALAGLRVIPGVGKSIAEDLYSLGYDRVEKLKGEDPEKMYEELCRKAGVHIDRCMLYVFRCAVYYATETRHDAEKLKWWNWKDGGPATKK